MTVTLVVCQWSKFGDGVAVSPVLFHTDEFVPWSSPGPAALPLRTVTDALGARVYPAGNR